MSLTAIVSYDDTENDHDALALGRVLAEVGTDLTLAYVRHAKRPEHSEEQLEQHEAQTLLERGAERLEDLDVEQRVVVSASTGEGLGWLAEQEHADIVAFGSDYRTAFGHVSPGRSAQTLLEGGPAAIALAPAGYHADSPEIRAVGVLAAPGDDETLETARDLAEAFGARITRDERDVDLLVVGSRIEAPHGRVMVSAHSQKEIENATFPVLVLARGVPLQFPTPALAA